MLTKTKPEVVKIAAQLGDEIREWYFVGDDLQTVVNTIEDAFGMEPEKPRRKRRTKAELAGENIKPAPAAEVHDGKDGKPKVWA